MRHRETEEERIERYVAEYRENMAISSMDPADREYLESWGRQPDTFGEPPEEEYMVECQVCGSWVSPDNINIDGVCRDCVDTLLDINRRTRRSRKNG